jgi:hypothetical protein
MVVAVLALGVTACSAAAAPAVPSPDPASSTASPVPSVEIPPDAIVIKLSLPPDQKQAPFQLDGKPVERIEVKADQPYVFRINNTSPREHNFFIGVAKDLAAREYSRLHGVHLWVSGVREVVYTFKADGPPLQFACTLAGHYGLMHADIVVKP